MMDDIVAELGDLRREADALRGLIAAAQASVPKQAEGSDSTGAVWATVGADGLPSSIWVQDDWGRLLPGERFGAAVMEAFSAAAQRRLAAWNETLADGGWLSTVDSVRADLDRPGHRPAPAPPVPSPRSAGGDAPRSLNAILNDLLSAFDNVDDLAARSVDRAEGTGTSGYHKLTIRLSAAGLLSCVVDEPWASQQRAATLVAAFDEALVRAKAELTAKAEADPGRRLDQVLNDALALLDDPQRLAES